MKNKSMKISEVLKITKPTYKYYKLVPNNSIRNNSTNKMARTIASIYRNIFHRIRQDEQKLVNIFGREFLIGTKYRMEMFEKVSYYIYIEKKKVNFYLIIPDLYEEVLIEKANDVWSGVTIREEKELPQIDNDSTKKCLVYEKEDALSLRADRRDNDLLRSNLNIATVLKDNDRVGIFYNFIPVTQHTWRNEYRHTIDKVKKKQPVDRDKSKSSFILKYIMAVVISITNDIVESVFGSKEKGNENALENIVSKMYSVDNISRSTIDKEFSIVLDAQIVVFSKSEDKMRQHNNVKALAQSFETIAENNRLIPKQYNSDINFNSYRLKAPTNKVSDLECQNFISLAGRDILEEYDFIEKIKTNETQVPEELQKGTFCIGENVYRGSSQKAFLSDDKEYKFLTQMLIGPTRAGKSTLISNLSNDALKNNECVIMFDFIKNCELSEEVAKCLPKDKVLNIECNNFDTIQGLGYNEVGAETDPFKQYDNAKKQTTQFMTLINSINSDDTSLTARMERYLTSAALVSFISNGSIKDIFDILQNHSIRHKMINKVPENQEENLSEYIQSLHNLDDYDKEGNIMGSKLNLVSGVIDRLNKLKANTYMELMLKKGTTNNIDLSKEIQKNQLICLKMPEDMFSTDNERDIYCTYWITKLWLALQTRAKRINNREDFIKVNLIIDEIYQVKNTEKFLTEKLSRLAKFGIKPIISCHYISQLKYMRDELRSANASYMLISGCDKNNYNEFKEELRPFEMDDLIELPRYHSLNLIKHKNGYGKFITKLPKPL